MTSRGLLVLVIVCLGGVAAAAPASDEAYAAGKAALRREAWAEAIAAFTEARTLAADGPEAWRAELGLALGHELAGELLASAVHYRRFLQSSGRSPLAAGEDWGPRRVEASASVERIEATLAVTHARVVVTSTPIATLSVSPSVLRACDATPCTLFVPPARYRIGLGAAGHHGVERVVDAVAGEVARVEVTLASDVVAPPVPAQGWPVASTITMMAGGAAAIVGTVMLGLAADDHARLERLSRQDGSDAVLADYDRTLDRMQDRELAGWVLITGGGLALASGLVIGLVE